MADGREACAQLSLDGSSDARGFVTSFAGDDRAVSDYLVSEVLSRQPAETLDFLLRTCQADRVSGELADALTGRHDGGRRSGSWSAATVSSRRSTPTGDWYRYPPLLLEVLRAESRRRLPERAAAPARAGRALARGHGKPSTPSAMRSRPPTGSSPAIWSGQQWMVFARGAGRICSRWPSNASRTGRPRGRRARPGGGRAALRGRRRRRRGRPAGRRLRARRAAAGAARAPVRRDVHRHALYRARLRGDVDEAVSAAQVALGEDWDADLAIEVRALTLANLGIAELVGRRPRGRRRPSPAGGRPRARGGQRLRAVPRTELRGRGGRPGRAAERGLHARPGGDRARRAPRLDARGPPWRWPTRRSDPCTSGGASPAEAARSVDRAERRRWPAPPSRCCGPVSPSCARPCSRCRARPHVRSTSSAARPLTDRCRAC